MDNTRDEAFSKRAIESLVLVREPTKVPTLEKLVSGIRRVFVFVLAVGLNTYCTLYALVYAASEPGVSGTSRSRPFPRMKASDSLSRIMEMDFFIPFPFPNCGNGFFHSLPIPEFAFSQTGIKTVIGLL